MELHKFYKHKHKITLLCRKHQELLQALIFSSLYMLRQDTPSITDLHCLHCTDAP